MYRRSAKRRSVPEIVEVPKSALMGHPLPEVYDSSDSDTPRQTYNTYSDDTRRNFRWEENSCSNQSSLSVRDVSTSSSWTDDDFEQEATRCVQQMFDDVNANLYGDEDTRSSCPNLENECSLWTNTFPHFRLVGKQIIPSLEDSFSFNIKEVSSRQTDINPPYATDTNHISDPSTEISLLVQGLSLKPDLLGGVADALSIGEYQEEIIEYDGVYEELIAVDNMEHFKTNDSDTATQFMYQSQIAEKVQSYLTSLIWDEVTSHVIPLVVRFTNYSIPATSKDPSHLVVDVPRYPNPPSGIRKPLSSLQSAVASRGQESSSDLNGVLLVSSKILVNRESPKPRIPSSKLPLRLLSGNVRGRDLSSRKTSSRGRVVPILQCTKNTLKYNEDSNKGISKVALDISRGSKISNLHLSPNWRRHLTLPPIGVADSSSFLKSKPQQASNQTGHMSNAVLDMSTRRLLSQRDMSASTSRTSLGSFGFSALDIRGSRLNDKVEQSSRELSGRIGSSFQRNLRFSGGVRSSMGRMSNLNPILGLRSRAGTLPNHKDMKDIASSARLKRTNFLQSNASEHNK